MIDIIKTFIEDHLVLTFCICTAAGIAEWLWDRRDTKATAAKTFAHEAAEALDALDASIAAEFDAKAEADAAAEKRTVGRLAKIVALAEHGATPGERAAAKAALRRVIAA